MLGIVAVDWALIHSSLCSVAVVVSSDRGIGCHRLSLLTLINEALELVLPSCFVVLIEVYFFALVGVEDVWQGGWIMNILVVELVLGVEERIHVVEESLILSCDLRCVQWNRVALVDWVRDPRTKRLLGKNLDGVLAVDAAAAFMHHLIADSSPCVWCCSVWEQYLVDLEKSLLVVDEQV